ncbi:unnamed protein product [Lactuca saligna]|uniref:Uncharacterized protein n=1 Tax=Lactuca saligna TaxID=75948 RepID=A0AA36EF54_LACSI|nr:unnamed protein product [Lactuca saligna]
MIFSWNYRLRAYTWSPVGDLYHPVTTQYLSRTITAKGFHAFEKVRWGRKMASTSGTNKCKGCKLSEKTYLPDSDFDDDAFDFILLGFSKETFKDPLKLCDDHFLNLLCGKNILRRSINGMVDDGDIPGVQKNEHAHLDEYDEDVAVEYRMHDPNVDWKEMRP